MGTKLGKEIFSKIPDTEAIPYPIEEIALLSREKGDILLANTRLKIDRETIEKFSGFQGFGTVSSGTDHVDFGALRLLRKEFINAPGCNAGSVAEYVWYGYLQIQKEIPNFVPENPTWGILGMGNTGRALARILNNHRFSYVFYDPYVSGSVSLQEAISQEILTIHVPLTRAGNHPTYRMLGIDLLKCIQKSKARGKIFINTSRGEVIQRSLLEALLEDTNLLGILDVFDPEPPDATLAAQLRTRREWIYTPHIAGYSQEGRVMGTYIVAEKLAARIGKKYPLIPKDFLQNNLDWKTENFIRIESNLLVRSWEEGNWEYFEKRRNHYPLREDAGLLR